ncbi:MAG: CoA transferase, partial [Myxococcales bacterium]|nr:CoA transferase [Myxococcales bacterium]
MPGPLEGLRVIDVGALIAGPWAATTLADQGADVIKVERPGVGDLFRHVGSNRGGMSGMFHVLNRGKRSLAVDLANPKGVEVFLALAATADVIVQNLRPGVVDRIGIGYEQVKEQREDIVYLSLSGFGSKGPYAHKRVYDNVIQTYSGLADAQMNPTTGEPEFLRQLLTDKLTAWAGAQAVTAALLGRALGRGGQHIEMSMLDTAVAFMWPDRAGDRILLGEGINEQPPLGPNFQLLPLADGFGTVTAFADSEFTGLCKALELHEIAADPRFANTAARMENLDLVTRAYRDAIGPAASKLTREEFERRL